MIEIRFLLAATCLFLCGCSLNNQEELCARQERKKHVAFSAFRDNNFVEAIEQYKAAVALADNIQNGQVRKASTLNDLARVYFAQRDFSNARDTYQQAIQLLRSAGANKANGKASAAALKEALIDSLEGLANASEKLKDFEQAEVFYKQALATASSGVPSAQQRQLVQEYQDFLSAHGRAAEAKDLASDEVNLSQTEPLTEKDDNYHETYNNAISIAQSNIAKNNFRTAEVYCMKALRYARERQDDNLSGDAATQLGGCYYAERDLPRALQCFQLARRYYEISGADEQRVLHCLLGYSRTLMDQGKLKPAENTSMKIVKILSDPAVAKSASKSEKSENPEILRQALGDMGGICAQQKRWTEAIYWQERCLNLLREQLPIDSTQGVLQTCYLMNMYYQANRTAAARDVLARYEKLLVQAHSKSIVDVAHLLTDYGNYCQKEKNKMEAQLCFQSAIRLLQSKPEGQAELTRAKTAAFSGANWAVESDETGRQNRTNLAN